MAFEMSEDASRAARTAREIPDLIEAKAPYCPQDAGRPGIAVRIIPVGGGPVEEIFCETPEQHGDA
jgi:hypothetical protein